MEKFRFKKWPVYEDGRKFRNEVKVILEKFPKSEQYALTSQIRRALDSILLNIAEGSGRWTDRDFAHFLTNANGSLSEVVAGLDMARDDQYIDQAQYDILVKKAEKVQDQLIAFRKKLRKDSFK